MVLSFLNQFLVLWQRHFCWCFFRIIPPSQFCGFVVLQQNITITHNIFLPVPYYKLQKFGSPPVCYVGYIGLWFKYFCIPLKLDIKLNSSSHKYFLNFLMAHINAAASPTKLCLDFYSGDTIDIKMKEIGPRCIPSRDLSNSHFSPEFLCAYDFIASTDPSACRSNPLIPSLDQSVLM